MNVLNNPLIFVLMNAIAVVESGNDCSAIGDSGKALGAYQIHSILVDDVNRIYGTSFKHKDAFDEDYSKIMFYLYSKHYANHISVTEGRPATLEDIARMWNGGPDGYRKSITLWYWEKVNAEFERLKVNAQD